MRPKSYTGSSGSVWASDQLKIKWEVSQLFEQPTTSTSMYALPLRKFSHRVHDVLFYFKDCTLESDAMCVTNNPKCKFREYEMKKLKWLKHQLSEAISLFNEEKEALVQHEVSCGTELMGIINNIQEVIDEINITNSTLSANTLWVHQKNVVNLCDDGIAFIKGLDLPPLCNYILQATDAGPGVGVTNIEVKYRDLEMSRINGWTHMNRIHRAPHDSGQNEAEHSNAAIGEALVDGRALHWEYYKANDLISEGEIGTLTVEEIKNLEAEAMERNAWKVAQDVVSRIDGEPGPAGDCTKAYVTDTKEQQFFLNTEYLQKYSAAKSEVRKAKVPGHNYFTPPHHA